MKLVDVTNGLRYMHGRLMVHGDLNGVHFFRLQLQRQFVDYAPQANILINRDRRACLADFGLSTVIGVGSGLAANISSISVKSKTSLMSFTAGGCNVLSGTLVPGSLG